MEVRRHVEMKTKTVIKEVPVTTYQVELREGEAEILAHLLSHISGDGRGRDTSSELYWALKNAGIGWEEGSTIDGMVFRGSWKRV